MLRNEIDSTYFKSKACAKYVLTFTKFGEKWQLPFNTGNCKVLHIENNNPCHRYEINGENLEKVDEEKDLGVIVDSELKFNKPTGAAVKKANMKLGMIKKSFANLDENILPILYTSFAFSYSFTICGLV